MTPLLIVDNLSLVAASGSMLKYMYICGGAGNNHMYKPRVSYVHTRAMNDFEPSHLPGLNHDQSDHATLLLLYPGGANSPPDCQIP